MLFAVLTVPGCGGSEVETSYGKNHSASVNGTSTFAGLFRAEGHEVRTAVRLSDELKEWADVIVRFAPAPGPTPRDEAAWYDEWFQTGAERRKVIYIPYDYNATHEYWTLALDGLPKAAPARLHERIVEARDKVGDWSTRLPPHVKEAATAEGWFAVESGKGVAVCKSLSGPWAAGLDPSKASLTRHETLKSDPDETLLAGDGRPLVVSPVRDEGGDLLVIANGSFLLNLPLVEPSRWPLARRVIDWAGDDGDDGTRPKKVAFVEGQYVLAGRATAPSVFALLKVSPFGQVAAQMLALGLAACLARAPRLGRPRPAEPSGADRPVAHPEALGALLARTGQSREARSILEAYRRWRHVAPASKADRPRPGARPDLNA